ncbi:hypothetical protein [Pseudomonas sp. DNDY-54]|uniref:hypothetical protein n=1 Tax=Pseudomonas sp. DNDY-54 TaxID=2870860 RepID=UPI001CA42928|nr:hypothetical protein [Pseudomonas sp. DNDY-54]
MQGISKVKKGKHHDAGLRTTRIALAFNQVINSLVAAIAQSGTHYTARVRQHDDAMG